MLSSCVEVNDLVVDKVSYLLKAGDKVSFKEKIVISKSIEIKPVAMDLAVVFEDEHILVINKPTDLIVHPGAGHEQPITLVHGLLAHIPTLLEEFAGPEFLLRPGIVHRLDKDTSGLMVCAKTKKAHFELSKQFHDRSCSRIYKTLLDGVIDETKKVHTLIKRHPKDRKKFLALDLPEGVEAEKELEKHTKVAKSTFTPVKTFFNRLTLCDVELETGRTHQIRVHACYQQRWIIGDPTYGRKLTGIHMFDSKLQALLKSQSKQLLHAYRLKFKHPSTQKELSFESPLPESFQSILGLLDS